MNEKIRKKYLLFTLEYPPFKGGVARYYGNLVKYWPEGDLAVLTANERPLLNKWLHPRWLPALWRLYKKIKEYKTPAENFHLIVGQILPLGAVAYYLSKFLKFKYSIILHGLDFSLALKRPKLTGKIMERAARIICANSYTAALVKKFDSSLAEKTAVVNPGIEPAFIRNPARGRELKARHGLEEKIILFGMGRMVKRKGFDKVIEAMPAIVVAFPNIALVLGGGGPEAENLKQAAAALPPEARDKIIFPGQLSEEDRWAWLELCDMFIMVSRNIAGDFEGFGIVYLEAGLAGKPVIAGDSGGVRDAVIDKVSGLLVNPENSAEIAAAVINLAQDETLRAKLGEHGQRRVVEHLSAKNQAEKIYRELNS
jgi:phosphatidyl-myo-inositol dimannoside synthase